MNQNLHDKLAEVLESHYSDPAFGATAMASAMGMSHSTLNRRIRSLIGKTSSQLIQEFRLNKSLELLKGGNLTIAEVAAQTGFHSSAYFSTSFRKHFGYTPSQTEKNPSRDELKNQNKDRPVSGWRGWVVPVAVMAFLIVSIWIIPGLSGTAESNISIAVLPFENGSNDDIGSIASELLWEEAITTLSQIRVFDIRSTTLSGHYGKSDKPVPEIAKELNADFIVEGRVISQDDSLKLTLHLIEAASDQQRWTEDYTFHTTDLNNIMIEISEHLAYELNTVLDPSEKSAILVRCSKSTESIENYLIGLSKMAACGCPEDGIPFFLKAIELDSTWPSPYQGLANAYGLKIRYEPSEELIRKRLKAIEKVHVIKPGPWSYSQLARTYMNAGDYKKARRYLKKGIRDFPEDVNVNWAIASTSAKTGDWKEAQKRYLIVNKMIPENLSSYYWVGYTYEMMRDFPQALSYFNAGISINPVWSVNYYDLADIALKWKGDAPGCREILENVILDIGLKDWDQMRAYYLFALSDICQGSFDHALWEVSRWFLPFPATWSPPYCYHPAPLYKALIYGYMGKPDLELAYYDSARIFIGKQVEELPELGKRPGVMSALGMAYAGLGNKEKAGEMVERVKELLSEIPDEQLGAYAMEDVAWIQMKTGKYRLALKTLRHLLSKPGPLTARMLDIDPKWAALKDQAGFQKLLKKFDVGVSDTPLEVTVTDEFIHERPEIKGPAFTDPRDGIVYPYRKIGNQVWMLRNLAYLPAVSPPDTCSYTDRHYYVFDYRGTNSDEARTSENYAIYGVLYNWSAAMDACPEGWHLPSDSEWKTLERHLGMDSADIDGVRERNSGSVGIKMKTMEGWLRKGNGDNSSGFYALPAGGWYYSGLFYKKGFCTDLWTSTEMDESKALFRNLGTDFDGVYRYFFDKRNGFSVRCLKDD